MKPKSKRTERRARERAVAKLFEQRKKLALLEPGGTPARPIEVDTASVIETRAESDECLRCGEPTRVAEHRAETFASGRLRVVVVRCSHCGLDRTLYFRIRAPS